MNLRKISSLIKAQLKRMTIHVKELQLTPQLLIKLREAGIGPNSFVWADLSSANYPLTPNYVEMKLHQLFNKLDIGAIYGIDKDNNWFLLLEKFGGYDVYTNQKTSVWYTNLSLDRAIRLLPKNNYFLYFIPTENQILEQPVYELDEDVENIRMVAKRKRSGQGKECDNCGHYLNEDDYDRPGSWSYRCPNCEFKYNHGGRTPEEQVKRFLKEQN
jgi:ribosomal protein L37AE/L43A